MFARYKLLSASDSVSEHSPDSDSTRRRFYRTIALTVLTIANVCLLGLSMAIWRTMPTSLATPNAPDAQPSGLARVESLPIEFIPFYWNTPWGAPNASEADRLWDNINTAHGHIAVDHEFAAENHWPPSMDIPGKPGKGLYLLQAYHQLHCLYTSLNTLSQRIVRAAYLTLKRQELPIFPSDHVLHCFDALRQHVMCHADNTPLYGHGHGIAGDGQLHQCRDWNALRDYATKNTACFRDGTPGMSFEDRFGVCDDGTDGLEERVPVPRVL
ncbi:hypothetical protein COCMIDRAFT_93339 [Bipolaris oryzae ATCC 44560]|uniref:Oxidase ustYa n=1 Tax=Bipolaris oryzae ATCC 44560 TaxID=930090 RepID=W6ZFH6_COCMI|nr:uncharacterized protein COCMIDRAFT_93339 [Bipolaris oryzae ATCC 44560]EUC46254.1 hypothetical protein COCMIDRAFT_93339 [Bipolaris oryzae ATCC 44560]